MLQVILCRFTSVCHSKQQWPEVNSRQSVSAQLWFGKNKRLLWHKSLFLVVFVHPLRETLNVPRLARSPAASLCSTQWTNLKIYATGGSCWESAPKTRPRSPAPHWKESLPAILRWQLNIHFSLRLSVCPTALPQPPSHPRHVGTAERSEACSWHAPAGCQRAPSKDVTAVKVFLLWAVPIQPGTFRHGRWGTRRHPPPRRSSWLGTAGGQCRWSRRQVRFHHAGGEGTNIITTVAKGVSHKYGCRTCCQTLKTESR